jgi:hypothetical protein
METVGTLSPSLRGCPLLSLELTDTTTTGLWQGEELPSDMGIKMENFTLDPDWVWLAKYGDRIDGFLAAAPCHGIAMVVRLVLRPEADSWTLPLLLRQFRNDALARGYNGFFAYMDPKRKEEFFIMKMVVKMGGVVFNSPNFAVCGNFNRMEKW